MAERTIDVVYYTNSETGEVYLRGEKVDLSDDEAKRGDGLNAFEENKGLATRALSDMSLVGGERVDPATIGTGIGQEAWDRARAAMAAASAGDEKAAMAILKGEQEPGVFESSATEGDPASANVGVSEDRLRALVENGTVDDVLSAVGNDPDKAELAMTYEEQRDPPRATLTSRLQAIIDKDA